jgi:hypothetical protein
VVSNPVDVGTPGTPQNLAMDWIINLDTARLCPQDPNLIQRYVTAVFYYSTRGDRWETCKAPIDVSDPVAIAIGNADCPNGDAWLTPSSECDWGGLRCDGGDFITRIDFGAYQEEVIMSVSAESLTNFSLALPRSLVCFFRTKWNRWNFTVRD